MVVAVSMLFVLAPGQVRELLGERIGRLKDELAEIEAEIGSAPGLPRLFLLDEEYRRSILEAELAWTSGLFEEIDAGRLDWSEEFVREIGARFNPPADES